MFIEVSDLGNAIYGYQIEQITEGDKNLTFQAINAAIEEVSGYLSGYDTTVIFSQTGINRSAILVSITVTVAKWHLVEICNAGVIYEQAKERYDRATSWLKMLSKGYVSVASLPKIIVTDTSSDNDSYGFGSRTKYTHDI